MIQKKHKFCTDELIFLFNFHSRRNELRFDFINANLLRLSDHLEIFQKVGCADLKTSVEID